jgi:hypothetical protein
MQYQTGKNNKVILWLVGLILLFGAALIPSKTAWAGDINDAEAGVISAASGTFEYDGKTYRAYSSYVNDLYAYLSKDGVDLSPGQAKSAINYIYRHVSTGIKRGYIYEVGGENDPNATTEQKTEATSDTRVTEHVTEATESTEATETTETTEQRTSQSTSKHSTEAPTEEPEPDSEVEEIFSKIEENQDNRQVINDRVKPEEADAKAVIREETIVIDTGDDVIELDSNKPIVPSAWPTTLMIVAIVTLVITVLTCLVLIFKRCMRFGKDDRKKPMHGHRKRRKIRKHCRRVLTVTTAVSIAGVFLLLALFVIVFNNSRILQSVQDSGYFRYAYIEYLSEQGRGEDGNTTEAPTEAALTDGEGSTGDDGSAKAGIASGKILSYDEFVIREKQSTEQLLLGNRDVVYQQSNVAPYVLRLKEDLQFSMIISSILFLLSLILGCVFTIFMDLRRDRGIRMIAVSELIGTAFAGILTITLLVLNPAKHLFIEPDYLYVFFKNHIDWMIRVLSIISVFGLVVGMTLIGLYFSKRKDKSS